MSIAVRIALENGRFRAELVGAPEVHAEGASREDALNALRAEVTDRASRGELAFIDVPHPGMTQLYGRFADDPSLMEICDEAYRLRDQEIAEDLRFRI